MIKNLERLPDVRNINLSCEDLITFENMIAKLFEDGKIKAPIHLSNGNEQQLLEIAKKIGTNDWVFSTWRSHYHALIKGIDKKWLQNEILEGRSITIVNKEKKFYSSAIVGSTIPIAIGVAISLKRENKKEKVWCFIGDMAFETGTFYEMYKYAKNYNLPIQFVVEDNGLSTYTPTKETWGGKRRQIPKDVIYYRYTSKWPHYGTGKWVVF